MSDLDAAVSLRDSDSFMSEWYSSLSNDDDKKDSLDSKDSVKNESTENGETKEDSSVKKEEGDKSEGDEEEEEEGKDKKNPEYYIVREQPNILQYALKEYQLVVSNNNININNNNDNNNIVRV